ncbi:MAG TPA: aminotransferase class V-fold PLP-dependent enzyme, partial [Polyangia bacterium]|nr:aminotransferase class V-fold PLP-dependent enzyme [Polyangia bacterium]
MRRTDYQPETLAAQVLGYSDPATGGVVPAIQPSTTYLREPDNSYRFGIAYSRADNPGYRELEALVTELEQGQASLCFASGMAAATTAFLALRPGDHVIAPRVMYWGLRNWLVDHARSGGMLLDLVPPGDLGALQAALRPGKTRLVWLETPANPTWEVTDIAGAAKLAHEAGAYLAVDSTVATPVFTRPLELGADLVMHSATKYFGGHSDVMAGTLTCARTDELWERMVYLRSNLGGILGPFEAWLVVRGLRTLFLRVRAASETALYLAQRLERHPGLVAVLYPGLASHPQHELAAHQMRGGFGAMLSLRVRGGEEAAIRVAAHLRLFKRATSLGGVESLVEHRA